MLVAGRGMSGVIQDIRLEGLAETKNKLRNSRSSGTFAM
jgi:hypothetical protein